MKRRLLLVLMMSVTLSACESTVKPENVVSEKNCLKKPEAGKCRAAITRFYFDQETQSCKTFMWGGCGGVVPFTTLESCRVACE